MYHFNLVAVINNGLNTRAEIHGEIDHKGSHGFYLDKIRNVSDDDIDAILVSAIAYCKRERKNLEFESTLDLISVKKGGSWFCYDRESYEMKVRGTLLNKLAELQRVASKLQFTGHENDDVVNLINVLIKAQRHINGLTYKGD
jgi:hypothetical protein